MSRYWGTGHLLGHLQKRKRKGKKKGREMARERVHNPRPGEGKTVKNQCVANSGEKGG